MIKDPVTGLILRTGAGLLLIAMGLYIGQWWKGLTRIEKLGQGLWSIIRPAASKLLPVQTLSQALLLGFFWGWLPCGLIYSTLIWSASAQHPLESAVLMFTFGLGTLPAMLATGLLANEVKQLLQRQWIHTVAGIVIIAFGIYTIPWTGLTH
jgi:sulfite exporter TauE/SafE